MLVYISRALLLFFCCLFRVFTAYDQYVPEKGAVLNYTSVCFSFPWVRGADAYRLELTDNRTGEKNVFTFPANKHIVNGLQFGTSYTWSVAALNKKQQEIQRSENRPFSIPAAEKTGKRHIRFKEVTNRPNACSDELLIFDYAQVATDHDQQIVWYLPGLPMLTKNSGLRDLKMTDEGTFLAIVDSFALELNINGKILWRAPNDGRVSGQGKEDYHHDLQKLRSGNYMVLGNEKVKHRFPGQTDTTTYEIGTIIEYTPDGNVAWEWHAKTFFTEAMLMRHRREDGTYDPATHLNAFHVHGNTVYAGFRDASWILKIDKTTKKVTEIYGGSPSGLPNHYATGLFRYQHDAQVLRDGSIAVINNDSIKDPAVVSSLVVFSQDDGKYKKGAEIFRFPFNFDSLSNGKSQKLGNVNQLENGNYLVNMGALNRIVELTPRGEVVWDVFIEKLDTFKNVWRPHPQYRVAATPSLYPHALSCKWEPKSRSGKGITGKLTVYNVGNTTESYRADLEVSGEQSGTYSVLQQIPAIEPGGSWSGLLTISGDDIRQAKAVGIRISVNGTRRTETLRIF